MPEIRTRRIIPLPNGWRSHTFVDVPGNDDTWDENAMIIASEYQITLYEAHRRLCRAFPDLYGKRNP